MGYFVYFGSKYPRMHRELTMQKQYILDLAKVLFDLSVPQLFENRNRLKYVIGLVRISFVDFLL